ncbi:MAG: hypothetical protein JWQ34_779 [Mucilaginibacter sp.]|uniref:thioredoxin family protein n=1 Tax=Mucilaginibacter sp. TaxID=1882438 RepID=UPI0026063402|nr:thioredoxin family protein [Mucilaginibacter sp.]MDB5002554.1 hypothetical protein [Mucilaginibacter sp.]
MRTFLFIFLLLSTPCLAQQSNGIIFQSGLSWLQIQTKAKAEKKYIFVDTYTTWCIPCKQMAAEIFPQKEVGDFFNSNFINFKVQIDRSKSDSYAVKKAYSDAKLIKETYKISAYPTYLFFNPEGELVHSIIGTSSGKEFIVKARQALDPSTQYTKLRKEFEEGRRDTAFLKLLIRISRSVNDMMNLPKYRKSYLETQVDLLTPQNIRLIAQSISSSKDIGYNVLINYPEKVDEVIGARWRNDLINDIAFDEYILPKIRLGGKKEIYPGGMAGYVGELNKSIDWVALNDSLQVKFNERADRLLLDAKTHYFRYNNDWGNLNKTLLQYVSQHQNTEIYIISDWLQYFTSFCKESKYLEDVLIWARNVQSNIEDPTAIKNYGLVLYKVGKKEQAIAMLLKCQNLLPKPDESITALIAKIKNGQKIDQH